MSRIVFLLLLVGMMAALPLSSAATPVDETTAGEVAHRWLNPQSLGRTALSIEAEPANERIREFKDDRGRLLAYIVDQPTGGFVIVSADDRVEPIVFFSQKGRCSGLTHPRNPLRALLLTDLPARIAAADGDPGVKALAAAAWDRTILSGYDSGTVTIWCDRLTTTEWDQTGTVNDSLGVSTRTYNLLTPNHYPAGCVAVAMGQIIKWFQYPERANGVHGITVGGSDTYGAFDDSFEYDQMPDRLENGATAYQIENIAKLLRDAGTASGMNYNSTESTAWGDVSDRFIRFFGYSAAQWKPDIPGFVTVLNDMINETSAGYPVIVAIRPDFFSFSGHALVADGYGLHVEPPHGPTTRVFHLNMGWGGRDDGWYPVPGFAAGGETWNTLSCIVYGIRPPVIRKVDAMISAAEPVNTFIGDDIYGTASLAQRISKPASPSSPTSFYIMIDNEGTYPDRFRFSATDSYANWTARYFEHYNEITSSITTTNWYSPLLRPGEKCRIRVTVEVDGSVPVGEVRDFRVRAASDSDATRVDGVTARAERVSSRPTVLIRLPGGTYSETMPSCTLPVGSNLVYEVQVRNDGLADERFTLEGWKAARISETMSHLYGVSNPTLRGWTVRWFSEHGRSITASVEAGRETTWLLAPGHTQTYRLEMTPDAALPSGHACQAVLRARSADRRVTDTIRGEAVKAIYEPHLLIATESGPFKDLEESQVASPDTAAVYKLQLVNESAYRDTLSLSNSLVVASPGWVIQYWRWVPLGYYEDITTPVANGSWCTPTLEPGQHVHVDITVSPSNAVPDGATCDVSTVLSSPNDGYARSEVLAHTVKGSPGPDLQIAVSTNAYGDMPVSSRSAMGEVMEFHVRLRNSGLVTDSFHVRAEETGASGWTIAYYDSLTEWNDVSAALRDGSWTVGPLTNGASREFRFQAVPSGTVPSGATCGVMLVATAQIDASVTDSVTAVAGKFRYEPAAVIKAEFAPAYQETEAEQTVSPSAPAVFQVRVCNQGDSADVFTLTADLSNVPQPDWYNTFSCVTYTTNGLGQTLTNVTDITSEIVQPTGWISGVIPVGASQEIRIRMKVAGEVPSGTRRRLPLFATSYGVQALTSRVDAVAVKCTYQPCVLMRAAGYGVYDASVVTQTVGVGTAVYDVLVRNDGGGSDSLALSNLTVTTQSGDWAVRFFDASDDTDVTAALNAGTLLIGPLARHEARQYRAEVTPSNNVPTNSVCLIAFYATSQADNTWFSGGWCLTQRSPCGVRIEVLGNEGYARDQTGRPTAGSSPITYHFLVRNEGRSPDSFRLTAWHASSDYWDWNVRYFDAPHEGGEITTNIASDASWYTPVLAPGDAQAIRVEVLPSMSLPAGSSCDLTLYAQSTGYLGTWDLLAVTNTTKGACLPQVAIRAAGHIAYSDSVCTQRVQSGSAVAYEVKLRNDGQASDGFWLVPFGSPGTWPVRYYDASSGGIDVTEAILSGTWVIGPLDPGAEMQFRMEVATPQQVPEGAVHALGLTAKSQGSLSDTDAVTALTRLRAVLRIVGISRGSGGEVTLSWQSDPDRYYRVDCSTNLTVTPAFFEWEKAIPGQEGVTVHNTLPPAANPVFYRIREQ